MARNEIDLGGYRPQVYVHGSTSYRNWHPDGQASASNNSRLTGEVGRNVDELDDELGDVRDDTRSRAGLGRFRQTRSVKRGNPHRG